MEKKGAKERIIEAASRLFYFKGYNQTGINQIIAEANVAKASMYQHFRSKEDIAVAYLIRRHAMWMGNLKVCKKPIMQMDRLKQMRIIRIISAKENTSNTIRTRK